MKVFIKETSGATGKLLKPILTRDAVRKGMEIVDRVYKADVVWHQVDKRSDIANAITSKLYEDYKGKFVFFELMNNGDVKTYQLEKANRDADYYYREYVERKPVVVNYKQEDISNLQINLINYLLGKTDKIELLDPFPLEVVIPLMHCSINRGRKYKTDNYNSILKAFNLSDDEAGVLAGEFNDVQRFGDCQLIKLLRGCDEIYSDFLEIHGVKNNVILNNSDNIIKNLLTIMYNRALVKNTTAETPRANAFKERKKKEADEAVNNTITTVRDSLFGSDAFQMAAKKTEMQMGVYSLFIPDNSMADGEIMIPHPKHVGVNTQVLNINGAEIHILHTRKCIVISNPDDVDENTLDDIIKKYSTGKFQGYDVYQGKVALEKIREYPQIGDMITSTRHPITTLITKAKVVGYTEDGSIRCNVSTALALKADADGDFYSISWSKWSDSLIYAEAVTIQEFLKAAKIKLDDSVYDNKFDINHFLSLKPESEEEQLRLSSETGLEQAEAKVKTKELTGLFGVIDRDIVQTIIINGFKPTLRLLEEKANVSQMLVQLKNILKDLAKGNLSDEFKESFCAIYLMKGKDLLVTANMMSKVLSQPLTKTKDMLSEWLEINKNVRKIKVEETKENFRDLFKSFFD